MRKIFLFLFLLLPIYLFAQFTDDFSDGDFTNNPVWSGEGTKFKINTADQLQLNDVIADTAYISTTNTSINNTEWNFLVKLSFATSGNNNARVYLTSDKVNLKSALNGYFVQVGEANDSIALYKQTGTTLQKIISGTIAYTNNSTNTLRIKVTKDNSGNWKLYSDITGGYNYQLEGIRADNSFTSSSYFGVFCKYTISNSTKFYFDDFYVGAIIVDTIAPSITNLNVISTTQLDVKFSEGIEQTSAENILNYYVNNGIGNPATAIRDVSDFSLVHLTFATAFGNGINTIIINNLKDFNNNVLIDDSGTFEYYQLKPMDIIINEILFDPKTGGYDFVEIYNRSDHSIDLKNLRLTSADLHTLVLEDIKIITDTSCFIFPKSYVVLTANPDAVKSQYYTANPHGFIKLNSMPSYNIDGDVVAIIDTSENIIDELTYASTMHFPLLNETKGISLERLSFDHPTQDSTNWHSAAESVGFATPAYKNSEYIDTSGTGNGISITPEIFSPDEDGYNDIVNITYHFDTPGFVGNVTIYDAKGKPIRNLVKSELLGNDGSFVWDGVTENKEKARIGIYVVFIEVFDDKGNVKQYKKSCVVGGRL